MWSLDPPCSAAVNGLGQVRVQVARSDECAGGLAVELLMSSFYDHRVGRSPLFRLVQETGTIRTWAYWSCRGLGCLL